MFAILAGSIMFAQYFAEAARIHNVDQDLLIRIAKCESNFRPNVVSANGLYHGMYQYLPSTWVATRKAMGTDPELSLVYDPREAINTTAWKITHGRRSAWPVCSK